MEWYQEFSSAWSWADPTLVLSFVGTVLIPFLIWRHGAKQSARDRVLTEQQTALLSQQEAINRRGRRDSLLQKVREVSGPEHIKLLWKEVLEFDENDREALLAVFRKNKNVALPGTTNGTGVKDTLSQQAIGDYVSGLEERYLELPKYYHAYAGLIEFIHHVQAGGFELQPHEIANLVTGDSALRQRPGHEFYRNLVLEIPEAAPDLLRSVESIDYAVNGGLRLNILTGTLLAFRDIDTGQFTGRRSMRYATDDGYRGGIAMGLDYLLQRHTLQSMDKWSTSGSTEPVTATVAWLIYAVGAVADVDDHHAFRMMQNLPIAINNIPSSDKIYGWGRDNKDVRCGVNQMKLKQSTLWEQYGSDIENAASAVGKW